MVIYHINEFKSGMKIIQDGEPCVILSSESIKPGKGQSFCRVRLRQIVSGKILDKTFKSGDFLESADVVEITVVYVYRDSKFWYFMDEKNFEEIAVSTQIIGSHVKWIIDQLHYVITLWNNVPVRITLPHYVALKIIKTTTAINKNNAGSSGTKFATVSTGAVISVPLFIQIGDLIRINTHSGTYVSRIK